MTTETADPLEEVARLASKLRLEGREAERERDPTAAMVDDLRTSKFFRIWRPRSLGGMELAPGRGLEVFEELAAVDSAAAWLVSNAAVITTFSQVFPDDGIAEIFAAPDTILAGAWFPPGMARRADGGYRVTGQWAFGSGCRHADWVTGMAVVAGADEQPEHNPDGSPRLVLLAIPAEEATVVPHWDTLGMRGTGSHDISVADVFVPDRRSFVMAPFTAPASAFRGPLYRFHMWLGGAEIAAVALGVARAAWDEFRSLAEQKRPSYTDAVLRDRPIVQDHVARAAAMIGAGRTYLHRSVDDLYARFEHGDVVDPVAMAPVQLASSHAVEAATRAVDLLQDVAGTSGIRAENGLERHFRDVHTIAQHTLASAARYESLGQLLLGKQSDWLFFYL